MPKYFIGSVLNPSNDQPESHDKTFAFTKEESLNMDLTGKPIRMEHDSKMEVGTIMKDITAEDGSKWVIGKLNDDGLMSKFAKYAIDETPYGGAYYTGLSLQHVHTQFASGKTEKKGVEVSLVVNPRREHCKIAFVDKENMPNQHETKKMMYKMNNNLFKMSDTKTVEKQPEVEKPQEKEPAAFEMSREDMMKVIIQQQKDLEKNTKDAEELKALKEQIEKDKVEELKKDTEKAYALSQALVDQWAESLDASDLTDADKESVMKMAKDYPRESMDLLRIAHCASKKHKTLNEEFMKLQKNTKNSKLQNEFESAIQKKRTVEEPVVEVHAASKKAKTDHVAKFLQAMSQYKTNGSAREQMREISDYNTNSRRPYY